MRRMLTNKDIQKAAGEGVIVTPESLEETLEGSDSVVVDLNEEGDKLQVRLDQKVANSIGADGYNFIVPNAFRYIKNFQTWDIGGEPVAEAWDAFWEDTDYIKDDGDGYVYRCTLTFMPADDPNAPTPTIPAFVRKINQDDGNMVEVYLNPLDIINNTSTGFFQYEYDSGILMLIDF